MSRAKKKPSHASAASRSGAAAVLDESLFLMAFRNSPAMQSVVRASDGVVVEVNDTFLKILKFTRDQVIGKTALKLNFWAEPQMLDGYRRELESKGQVLGREVRLRASSGEVLTVLLSSHPIDLGGVPHYLSAGVDITARREAEARSLESEAKFRSLYDLISSAVVVHGENGILQVNPAALKLLGATRPEQVLGKQPHQASPPTQPDGESSAIAAHRHMTRALAEGTHHFEWMARKLDGTDVPIEVTLTSLHLDGRKVLQAVINDLTDRKRAEAELQKALAQERELNQLKSDFVSLVSHEFRTPLEIILSSTDNLQRYHERLPAEKRDQLLRTIQKSVRRMSYMMEDVLVMGRLDSGHVEFKPVAFDLVSFCRRLCDEMETARNHRCPIRVTAKGKVAGARGDEGVLRHILTNLLSNAMKYSEAGQPVELNISRRGRKVVFQIMDRGCGIPTADQARLFQAFHRASNARQFPGTGLGLVIVKRSVELHGGEIQFESAEGKGTTFTVRLPMFQ